LSNVGHTVISFRKGHGTSGCGGSIISKNVILTAAHCVWGATDILIKMGHSNTTSEKIVLKMVETMLIHPEYDHETEKRKIHDIALLRIEGEINFDKTVQPIALGKKEVQESFGPILIFPQG
jgi:hypothetical protein